MNNKKNYFFMFRRFKSSFIFVFLPLLIVLCISLNIFTNSSAKNNNPDILKVHYINVGQGDSILIQINNINMLIDSGPKSSKKDILSYLQKTGIKNLDYVIATHPHDDHIGNMDSIISKYKISNFYAPKTFSISKDYEKMIEALDKKHLKINIIKENNNSINLGKGTKVSVFSPVSSQYDDINDYSPIIKITYKNNSFLFTGDAGETSEKEVLSKGYNLKSDILKVGHHGSKTSCNKDFVNAVSPKAAVISCGKNNDYGHPDKETLKKLTQINTRILRTDQNEDIIFYSDGNIIKLQKNTE